MKKRFNFFLTTLLSVVLLCGCYKEDVDTLYGDQLKLESLLEEMRGQCGQINDIVEVLQKSIGGTMIKDVKAFKEEETGRSGWEITFTDGSSYKVYNGLDAKVPEICVMQKDDVWYWTLNGDPITDKDGNPIPMQGKDGQTPFINDEGFWVIGDKVTDIPASGKTPTIEINDDGYWVIDGTVTTVKATATEPQIATGAELIDKGVTQDKNKATIVNTDWYLSVDNGRSWLRISGRGDITGGDGSGSYLGPIKKIELSDDGMQVIITLANNKTITVPSWAWAEQLEQQVNDRIQALEDWINGHVTITSVDPIGEDGKDGWCIHYSNNDSTNIFNGKDGNSPTVGVMMEDKEYYWTVNNEPLIVEGNKVKANGVKPIIKKGGSIVNATMDTDNNPFDPDAWYLSYNEIEWTRVSGKNGDAFFSKAPEITDKYVTFTLTDGTPINVARYEWVQGEIDRINREIDSLKKFIDSTKAKYILSVEEILDSTKRYVKAYKITFNDNTEVTLGNTMIGVRGATPADGGDGQDLYWTINGVDLHYNGKPIKANANAASNTPQIKTGQQLSAIPATNIIGGESIRPESYYLSIDGQTWVRLTGEQGADGPQGAKGDPGDAGLIVKCDTIDNGDYYRFTFNDGITTIDVASMKKVKELDDSLSQLDTDVKKIQGMTNKGLIIDALERMHNQTTGQNGTKIILRYLQNIRKKDSIEIWDGTNGTNGKDPDIQVRGGDGQDDTDTDGYYWWVNGDYLRDIQNRPIRINTISMKVMSGEELLTYFPDAEKNDPNFSRLGGYVVYASSKPNEFDTYRRIDGPKGDSGDSFFDDAHISTDSLWVILKFKGSDGTIKVPTSKWAKQTEDAINETNDRIDALKNLLDTMKFIKSFKSETDADNRTKYTIELVYIDGRNAGTYELTSGAKGDPGEDGKTPTISIAADPNNNNDLFWTVNGKFIPDPNNPGKNVPVLGGKDGNDAPTPRLELGSTVISDGKNEDADEETIVATNVYLSVDGGTTWRKVNGDNGKDGEPVIKEVDTTNKDYVTFKLKDGTSFDVPRYVEVTVQFAVTTEIFRLPKNSYQDVGFTIEGTAAPTLSLTTIVGGNWKIRQNYNSGELSGTLTVYAPGTWDYNKVVLLLSDKKGRVWTNSLKVETEWTIGDPFVDSRDERTYSIKQFGDKLWMTEDLKHNSANGYAYRDLTDLCPTDWRVPDNDDWSNLATNLDASLFGSPQTNGGWWSSTSLDGNGNATVWTINAPSLGHETIAPNLKRGVRCIKDGTNPYDTPSSGN